MGKGAVAAKGKGKSKSGPIKPVIKSTAAPKGKGKGGWVWVEAAPAKTKAGGKASAKGGSKGAAKAGIKSKGQRKGKSAGKGKRRGLFTELSEEKQEEIQAKWAARAERENRTEVGSTVFKGTCVWRCKTYGWVKPANALALPKKVKDSMSEMTTALRNKALENDSDASRFEEDVLYFRVCDRGALDQKIDKDMDVTFRVYIDDKGAGARDVSPA